MSILIPAPLPTFKIGDKVSFRGAGPDYDTLHGTIAVIVSGFTSYHIDGTDGNRYVAHGKYDNIQRIQVL